MVLTVRHYIGAWVVCDGMQVPGPGFYYCSGDRKSLHRARLVAVELKS